MNLTVFGGSGAIGSEIVKQADEAGHELTIFSRHPSDVFDGTGGRVIEGELTDPDRLRNALVGADAAISALGPSRNSREETEHYLAGIASLIAAVEDARVRRLVALSGAAVQLEGERKRFTDAVASALVRRLARHVVEAKQREYELLRESGVHWILVRPPRVVEGRRTGRYRHGDIPLGPRSRVTRGDLAEFMLAQVSDDRYLRQAPFVSS